MFFKNGFQPDKMLGLGFFFWHRCTLTRACPSPRVLVNDSLFHRDLFHSFTEIFWLLEVLNKKATEGVWWRCFHKICIQKQGRQISARRSAVKRQCNTRLTGLYLLAFSEEFTCAFEIHLGFRLNLVVTFAARWLIFSNSFSALRSESCRYRCFYAFMLVCVLKESTD